MPKLILIRDLYNSIISIGMVKNMSNLIEINNFNKIYNTEDNDIIALNNVSLKINKGDFVAIVGTSGSGKSTLMNMIGCLDTPNSGEYLLDGIDILSQNDDKLSEIRNRKIGFIFQGFNLIQSLTAVENVELPLLYRNVSRHTRKDLAKQALTQVGLLDRISHLPSQMSGGQQQRVAIARAIAARPPILLADEPTGNLDKKSSIDIMEILMDLHQEGKTIILITHDMAIAKLAQRIFKMENGSLTE